MDADISQCHSPGNDWSRGSRELSATAAQICQAGNYFISGEKKRIQKPRLTFSLTPDGHIPLKFEGCKPVQSNWC